MKRSVKKIGRRGLMVLAMAAAGTMPLVLVPTARADKNWNNAITTGNWNTTSNWAEGNIPNSGDQVFITANDSTTRTITYDASLTTIVNLQMGNRGTGSYTLSQTSAINLNCQSEAVGYNVNGKAVHTQSAGTNTYGWFLSVGDGSGTGSGTYNLSNTGAISITGTAGTPSMTVGYAEPGTFNQTGGTVTVGTTSSFGTLKLGESSSGNGTYSLSGTGSLTVTGAEFVGNSGSGTFVQSGGTHTVKDSTGWGLEVGRDGNGTYNLSAGALISGGGTSNFEIIGLNSSGSFVQSGGSNNTGILFLGYNSGSSGSYSLSNTGIVSLNNAYVGGNTVAGGGTGVLNIGGGTMTVTGALKVWNTGSAAPGGTRVNLSGGTLSVGRLLTSGNPSRFHWTAGTLNITDDVCRVTSASVPDYTSLGNFVTINANQVLSLTGDQSLLWVHTDGHLWQQGGTISATETRIAADSTVSQSGGLHSLAALEISGPSLASEAAYSLSGSGILSIGDFCIIGTDLEGDTYGYGSFTQTSGSLTCLRLQVGYSWSGGSHGDYLQSGGTTEVTDLFIGRYGAGAGSNGPDYGTYNISDGTLTVDGNAYLGGDTGSPQGGIGGIGILGISSSANVTVAGTLKIWNGAGSYVQLSGGSLSVGSLDTDGHPDGFRWFGGTLTLTSGGANNFAGDFYVGNSGTCMLNLQGHITVIGTEWVGSAGSSTVVQSGNSSSNSTSANLLLATSAGASANYTLNGGAVYVGGAMVVGVHGPAAFAQNGGSVNAGAYIDLGQYSDGAGSYTLGGGSVSTPILFVGQSGVGTFNQTGGTVTVGTASIPGTLKLGEAAGGNGTYNLSNTASLTIIGAEFVGKSGSGTFVQSGGTHTVADSSGNGLELGQNAGSVGSYSLSGTGVLNVTGGTSYFEIVGVNGICTFAQSGGSNSTGILFLGFNAGSSGTYTLSSGTLTIVPKGGVGGSNAYIGGNSGGAGGTGILNIGGGTMTVTGALKVWNSGAAAPGGTRVNLSGGTLSVGSLDTSGNPSRFNWTGGTLSITGLAGFTVGSTGPLGDSVSLTAGKTLSVSNGEAVGVNSVGTFVQSGGTNTIFGELNVGWGTTGISQGTYSLSATGILTSGYEILYYGTFTQTGGTNSTQGLIIDGPGRYSLSASGALTVSGNEIVGQSDASASFTQSGGTHTVTSTLYVGTERGSSQYDLSAGRLSVNGSANVGASNDGGGSDLPGPGVMNISGIGTMTVSGTLKVWDTGAAAPGGTRVNLSGGTLSVGSLDTSGNPSRFNWTGGTLRLTASTLVVNGSSSAPLGQTPVLGSGQMLIVDQDESIGVAGSAGTFTQSGGTHSVTGTVYLGKDAGTYGRYNLDGGQLLYGDLIVGNAGTGTFSQTGGTFTKTGAMVLGKQAGSSGSYILSGGVLNDPTIVVAQGGTGNFSLQGGTLNAGSLQINSGGTFSQSGGVANVSTISQSGGAFNQNGGTFHLNPGGGTARLSSLSISPSGNVDLADGKMIIDYSGGSPAGTIRQYLINGRGSVGVDPAPTWAGSGGITSSMAAVVDPTGLAVGYREAQPPDFDIDPVASFGGQTVDDTAILIRYTYCGDANLDGVVNRDDLLILQNSFNQTSGVDWLHGDFDYNGTCDRDDLLALQGNYGNDPIPSSSMLTAQFGSDFAASFAGGREAAVPEPAGLGLLAVVALIHTRRQRRSG